MHAFDRQADRILIARPRLHFMQRGKKVVSFLEVTPLFAAAGDASQSYGRRKIGKNKCRRFNLCLSAKVYESISYSVSQSPLNREKIYDGEVF